MVAAATASSSNLCCRAGRLQTVCGVCDEARVWYITRVRPAPSSAPPLPRMGKGKVTPATAPPEGEERRASPIQKEQGGVQDASTDLVHTASS